MKDRRLEQITDKNGVRTHRWKKDSSSGSSNASALRSAFGSQEVKAKPKRSAKRAVEGATGYPVDAQDATAGVLVGTRDEWNNMSNKERFEMSSAVMKQITPFNTLKQDHGNWTEADWNGNIWKGKGRLHVADERSHLIESISANDDSLDEVHVVPAWKVLGDGDDENPTAVSVADDSRRMMTSMRNPNETSEDEIKMRSSYYQSVTDGDAKISATMFMGPHGPIYKADAETAHAAQGASMGAPMMLVPVHVGKRYDLLSEEHPSSVMIGKPSDARPDDAKWYAERDANMRKLGVYYKFGDDGAHVPHDSPLRRYPWMLETPERVEAISKAYQEEYPQFGKDNDLEASMLDAGSWRNMWSNKRGLFG